MARSWQDIEALPEFQALDERERERLRAKYFRHVVAPTVPLEELDARRAAFDAETAPPERNASFWGDIPDLMQRGAYNAVGGVADFVGADTLAQWLYRQAQTQERTLTPATVAALQQPLFSEEGDYYLGEGFTNPRAWAAHTLDVAGGMAVPIPGGALARAALRPLLGLGKAATAAKGVLQAEGMAERAATRLAQRLAPDWRDTAATVAGYGGMEGLVSAGLAEKQTREGVLQLPQAQREQTPAYWEAMQQAGGDPVAARQRLAEDMGKEAGFKTLGPTVALGALAGRYYDKLIGGGGTGSRVKNALQGGATEMFQEGPQSVAETLAQNTTLQAVDPTRGAWDEAVPNLLTGAVLGGVTGGAIAGMLPKGTLERAATVGEQAAAAGLGAQSPPSAEEWAAADWALTAETDAALAERVAAAEAEADAGGLPPWAPTLTRLTGAPPAEEPRGVVPGGMAPAPGDALGVAPRAAAVPAVEPVRGDPAGPRPDADVWADEPDLVEQVPMPDGEWHIMRRTSRDGQWHLYTYIDADGVERNQEVWRVPPAAAPGGAGGQTSADEPRFHRGAGAARGMSPAAVRAAVARQMAPWAKAPAVVVFAGWEDPAIPARVRDAYDKAERRRKAKDPRAKPMLVKGFWSGGTVYVNAAAMTNRADLERTVRHEVLGHAGLRAVFGPGLVPILDRLILARRGEVVAKATALELDTAQRTELRQAAEEVLADLAMTRPELGFVRQVVALIKAKLREWGLLDAARMSEEEILREWVIPARNFIERGRQAAAGRVKLAPAFQREEGQARDQARAVDADEVGGVKTPLAGEQVSGLTVLAEVPNQGSISASLNAYDILPGIREIAVAEFPGAAAEQMFYAADDRKRVRQLAAAIKASGEIKPLIVVFDQEGPYVLEGGHRLAALHQLGVRTIPALVVVDTEALPAFNRQADPDIRFRLTDPADEGGSPLGGGRAWLKSVRQAVKDGLAGKLDWALAGLTLRQLADVGSSWVPLVKTYDQQRLRMETRRNVMMEESGRLGDAADAWARHPAHQEEAQRVWDLMNASTDAQADPSDYQVLKVPLRLGPGAEMVRNWEATMANVQELRRRTRVWKKSKLARERELAAYYQQAARQLFLAVKAERKRQAALPALTRQWAALSSGRQHLRSDGQPFASEAEARTALQTRRWPPGVVAVAEAVPGGWALQELGGKEIFTRFRDLYAKRSTEMMEALIKRLDSLESLNETDKRALAAKIRAEFEAPFDEKGNPRVGPYFPFQRWGRFFVYARRYVDPAVRQYGGEDGASFASAQAAREALKGMPALAGANVRPVRTEDGGWVLEDRGEEGFWLAESIGERRELVRGLEAEGWSIQHQGLTAEAQRVLEGVSEGFMAEAVDKLRKQGAGEEADTLYQMYLQTLQQMSIRKHFLHRKGTPGYTRDQLRAFGWNMTRLAHQISKLEGLPGMEATLRAMKQELKERVRENPGLDTTREDTLLEEIKRRHEWIANPTNAAWTNAAAALGFVFYLGVSPAAALVNLTQLPIVALPVLAGRLRGWNQLAGRPGGAEGGTWGEAGRALSTAFADVARGFKPGVIRGFVTGRPLPSEAANLSDEERAAFATWDETGARDRTQAHNLAGIGDADSWLNGPTFNRVMSAIASLFHLAEVVNRDATLLAGYRLARSRGMSHETAVHLAEEATWEAHYDYSNANRARFMQGDVAKVLWMFKNFAQHTFYFLGRNLYLWAKGEDAATQREARTKFAGMVGMTALFAGTAGLPIGGAFVIANLVQALSGDDDEPWDAETEWRALLAQTFPGVVADVIERGAVNTATGLDFASRVSIGDLLWRSPDRDLDGAGMFQYIVEQMLGPIGGIAARPFSMLDEVREGHWSRAAEAVVPKFARDLIQAGRFGAEGVLSRRGDPIMAEGELSSWELFAKGMGFTPDDLRVQYDQNAAVKLYEGRIEERRRTLILAAALAMMAGDPAGLRAARERIAAFNRAVPAYPISAATLRRSVRARQMMSARARNGIIVNPRLAYLRAEVGGDDETEGDEE